MLTDELAADLTPPTSLQPLHSKQLDVVELRPSSFIRWDLAGTSRDRSARAHTHTHSYVCSAHIRAVEGDQPAQFGDEQLVDGFGVSVAARQSVAGAGELQQVGQLGQLVHQTPLTDTERQRSLGSQRRWAELSHSLVTRPSEREDTPTSLMLLLSRFSSVRAGNMDVLLPAKKKKEPRVISGETLPATMAVESFDPYQE